jgi:putative membrane protein
MVSEAGRWRRLDPVTILMDIWPVVKQLGFPLLALIFTSVARGDAGSPFARMIMGAGMLLAIPSVMARYLSFRYRLGDEEIELRWGILRRHERRIPYGRIQNIDINRNAVARVTGTAELKIETGGGDDDPEGQLRMLSYEDALALQLVLAARAGAPISGEATGAPMVEPLIALAGRELALAGLLHGRGVIVVAAFLGLALQLDLDERMEQLVPQESVLAEALSADWSWQAVVAGVLISWLMLVVVLRLLSSLWLMAKWYGFRLAREGDSLTVASGLISREERSMPIRRIQTATVRSTVLQRAAGRVAVGVATAGGSVRSAREWLAPLVRNAELSALLSVILPTVDPSDLRWREVHRSIQWRRPLGWLLIATPVAAAAWLLGEPNVGVALLVMALLYGSIRGILEARRLGWAAGDGVAALRQGGLTRSTTIIPTDKVQTVIRHRSPFDRMVGTTTVTIDTAGSGWHGVNRMSYLPAAEADQLAARVAGAAAATDFKW